MSDERRVPEASSVTLPRWLVVMIFGTVTAALGAFVTLERHLASVDTRLSIIEYRIGLASPSVSREWRLQVAPPAQAEPSQPVVP